MDIDETSRILSKEEQKEELDFFNRDLSEQEDDEEMSLMEKLMGEDFNKFFIV